MSDQYLAKEEIVAAALDRRMYTSRLRDAAAAGKPASRLRQLQQDIPASLVNWLLLNLAVFTPFIREGYDNQRRWERRFYGDRFG